MFCPQCGYQMDDFEKTCPRCAHFAAKGQAPRPTQGIYQRIAELDIQLVTSFVTCGVVIVLSIIFIATCISFNTSDPTSGYLRAFGNVYTGVTLYYGEDKAVVGIVLGGNERHTDPITGTTYRGVKIRYPSGEEEWADNDAINDLDNAWFVRRDDPAVKAEEWTILVW